MLVDKTDLVILRHLEHAGRWFDPLPKQLGLSLDEIMKRIKNMEDERVISDYKASIFVPPFLGGDWVWGCILANASNREKAVAYILQRIPFVSEIWYNANIPPNLGHNFSLVFYSKDFDAEIKFLKEISEITYLEAYRITDFAFPIARVFSSEENLLLKTIFTHPTADSVKLAELCLKDIKWVEAKLEKLIWTPQNSDGVISVLPEIYYKRLENFCHTHFILELNDNPELLFDEFKTLGFEIVLDGRPFQGRYIQLEADTWGFNDLLIKRAILEKHRETKLAGIVIAEEMRVCTDWGLKLVSN